MRGEAAAYIAGGAAVVLVGAMILRAWLRRGPTPEELERIRRNALNRSGKMADATVIDIHENTIQYSYDVRGVEYTATQDISGLLDQLPEDRMSVAGAAGVKYDPRNPANSVVLCEEWSGLRPKTRIQPLTGMREE